MNDLQIDLRFWQCTANSVDDLIAFASVLKRNKVILLKHKTLEPISDEEWRSIFQKEHEEKDPLFKWSVDHALVFEDWGELNTHYCFDEYKEETNKLEFGGLMDFEFKDDRPMVEPFSQRLLAIARDLYPLARPTFGEVEGGWGVWNPDEVRQLGFKNISWVNFFSPAYVEKYGRSFLLGLPGYKTEELPDGGIFHQLSQSLVAAGEKEAKALRKEVVAYCARAGLKVSCDAPFVVPGLVAPEKNTKEKAISDRELKAYLKEILSATLVLDDGTRVKPVSIPWEVLSPRQERMALNAIRRAAAAEIRQHGRTRIRFEFSEIPPALDQMLSELAGRDNSNFEWVQVDMP